MKLGPVDWFVMLLFAAAWVVATVWLFKYPSVPAFGIWAGMLATMGSVYHWLVVRDQKLPDANQEKK